MDNKQIDGQQKSLALTKEYVETVKFTLWLRKFTDSGSKTFGNATQSAIEAYNYDPTDQYKLATVTGVRNRKKAIEMGIVEGLLEKMGFGFGDLLRIGMKKVLEGDFQDWERMMKLIGFFEGKAIDEAEYKTKVDIQAIINNWGNGDE